MFKLLASIKKEFLQLLSDKAGLALLFIMPLILVFVVSIIQDSAYRIVNDNVITMLVLNEDEGESGDVLIDGLSTSGLFDIQEIESTDGKNLKEKMLDQSQLTSLHIPSNFSALLKEKASAISNQLMVELELEESSEQAELSIPELKFNYDPILQEQYCQSVVNVINAQVEILQSELMIDVVFSDIGLEETPKELKTMMLSQKVTIEQSPASGNIEVRPNSTQHNVPAWTIFAMFFMVVSLGGNLVREKTSGSFLRLRSTPTSMTLVIFSKIAVYVLVGILQVLVIFTAAKLSFPSIGLPELTMPANTMGFLLVIVLSSAAAVSFAMLIGSFATSQVQANGVGAVLVVVFAALGGIWVPTFIMPEYLQTVAMFSPLNWCLEGFYSLFLTDGKWGDLGPSLLFLTLFVITCLGGMLGKMKIEKLI